MENRLPHLKHTQTQLLQHIHLLTFMMSQKLNSKTKIKTLTDEIRYVEAIGETSSGSTSRVVNAIRVVIGSCGGE